MGDVAELWQLVAPDYIGKTAQIAPGHLGDSTGRLLQRAHAGLARHYGNSTGLLDFEVPEAVTGNRQ